MSRAMDTKQLTTLLLRVFVVSIIATALVGVIAIASPQGWWAELKIFITTGVIAAASVCGLACGGCLARGRTVLPLVGLALTGIGAILLLFCLWTEIDAEILWKIAISICYFAVACAHLAMLFMAHLSGRYRWAYLIAYQLIFGLAALLAAGTITETLFNIDGYIRFTGVVAVLVAAITLLIPVFHYMSRADIAAEQAEADPIFAVDEEIARTKKRLIRLEDERRMLLGRVPKAEMEATVERRLAGDDTPTR